MTAVYLHTHFGAAIGPDLCREIRARGVLGVRVDLQYGLRGTPADVSLDTVAAIFAECADAGLDVLAIVTHHEQIETIRAAGLWNGQAVELRNEPDLDTNQALTPVEYASLIPAAVDACCRAGIDRLYVGAISNLNRRGLDYLRQLRPTFDHLPAWVRISIHRYPHGGASESWSVPHDGFQSRAAEVGAVGRIIGQRRFAVTETGYHCAPRTSGWWIWRRTVRRTEAQQLQETLHEVAVWSGAGADFVVLYQINSGPNLDDPGGSFGWRRFDGTWRPVADVALVRRA